jgi:hypothetical protein
MNNIEELRKTIQGAPKGATHIDFNGIYLKYDLNKLLYLYHVNYKEWQWASNYICPDQSLADIRTIIEQQESHERLLEELEQLQADYLEIESRVVQVVSEYNDLIESYYS